MMAAGIYRFGSPEQLFMHFRTIKMERAPHSKAEIAPAPFDGPAIAH
jgi:hypothetical protein